MGCLKRGAWPRPLRSTEHVGDELLEHAPDLTIALCLLVQSILLILALLPALGTAEPRYLVRTPRFCLIAIAEDTFTPDLARDTVLEIFDICGIAARRSLALLSDNHAADILRPRG